jgi:hypothetical protein
MLPVLHEDILEKLLIEYFVEFFLLNNLDFLNDHIIYHYYNVKQIFHVYDYYQVLFLHYDNQ